MAKIIVKEIIQTKDLWTKMGNEIKYFGYSHLLIDRVQSLAQEINKKKFALIFFKTGLYSRR